jgi:anti-anti-sigma factor
MNKYEIINLNSKIVKIAFSGEITLDNSLIFKEEIKNYLVDKGIYFLIIDLNEVEFIDSSGLGMLISFFKEINEKKGQLVYIGIHDYVAKIIDLVQLGQVFIIKDDEKEALEVLKEYYE